MLFNHSITIISLLCLVAFAAGFVDSIAGGGGLIQIPGLMFLLPNIPVVNLLGTNKLASCVGTSMSSFHYIRASHMSYRPLIPAIMMAGITSMIGALTVSHVSNEILKPIVFILLIFVGIYTIMRKDFGKLDHVRFEGGKLVFFIMLAGLVIGFYDGFLGPGSGSFLFFYFVTFIGLSFLQSLTYAKLINLTTNLSAVIYFASTQHIVYSTAIPMAVFNALGNWIGAKLAIKKSSGFVRSVFLIVIAGILIQMLFHVHFLHMK